MSKLRSSDSRKRISKPRKESHSSETESTVKALEFWRLAFASDSFWQEVQALHDGLQLLLLLRPKLRALAKRYRDRPHEFVSALDRLLNRYAKRFGLPQTKSRSLDEMLRPTHRVSKRQVRAMIEGSEILSSVISRSGKIGVPPNHVGSSLIRVFTGFQSGRPGPKPRPITNEIRYLYHERRLRGYAKIASMVFPAYRTASADERLDMREQVREAVRSPKDT